MGAMYLLNLQEHQKKERKKKKKKRERQAQAAIEIESVYRATGDVGIRSSLMPTCLRGV